MFIMMFIAFLYYYLLSLQPLTYASVISICAGT